MVLVPLVKTIQIDDEVYSRLLENVSDFGETPNSVLRRLMGIQGAISTSSEATNAIPIVNLLESLEFRLAKGAVGRFLHILSWLYRTNPETFHLVENVRGRGRIYFAKSAEILEQSGRSVNPKRIPGSPYWVITTTPTNLKEDMIAEVMTVLGCDAASIRMARAAIGR